MIVGRVERFGESGVCVVCVCVCVVGVCGCVEREEESGVWCQVDTHDRLLGEPELLLARGKFAIGCEWIGNSKKNQKIPKIKKNQKIE